MPRLTTGNVTGTQPTSRANTKDSFSHPSVGSCVRRRAPGRLQACALQHRLVCLIGGVRRELYLPTASCRVRLPPHGEIDSHGKQVVLLTSRGARVRNAMKLAGSKPESYYSSRVCPAGALQRAPPPSPRSQRGLGSMQCQCCGEYVRRWLARRDGVCVRHVLLRLIAL